MSLGGALQVDVSNAPIARSVEDTRSVSDFFAQSLVELGIRHAFGILGGAVVPFVSALGRTSIQIVHTRHETGAVFAAMEAHFASARPAMVFATTGPGVMNALNGISAARWDGAKVLLVSGATPAAQRGRWAFQETSPYTFRDLDASPALFDFGTTMQDPAELELVVRRLAAGFARPGGFVAHVAIPTDLQVRPAKGQRSSSYSSRTMIAPEDSTLDECARALSDEPFAIWVGFGARGASRKVAALAERSGAPVLATPRAKGIFPEDHPQFLGVTGLGGEASVARRLARSKPQRILVLGSRLGEFSSFWRSEWVPPKGFIHVDIDPDVPGAAYPAVPTLAVHAEIGVFLQALLPRLLPSPAYARPTRAPSPVPVTDPEPTPGAAHRVRTSELLRAVQRVIVDGSDAIVLTEAGNAFAWCSRALRFRTPGRYRVSTGYGSMGHSVAGVVGAALTSGKPAVCVAGDGAMLMQAEISTAVQYGARAIWIVLNDGRYGMVEQGMRAQGFAPLGTGLPTTDFVLMARALGADGRRVSDESELTGALQEALDHRGPYVVDVVIDPRQPAPFEGRIQSLIDQGAINTNVLATTEES
jgi:acetolactate synthase-1/2/3 large subunit